LYFKLQRIAKLRRVVQNFDRGHVDGRHSNGCRRVRQCSRQAEASRNTSAMLPDCSDRSTKREKGLVRAAARLFAC
jgi:hypothetical protein